MTLEHPDLAMSRASAKRHFPKPVLLIDTREQTPLDFRSYRDRFSHIVRATLKTGDYSIYGFEDKVAIERKSLSDFTGSLTWGRERFFRELERLEEIDHAVIVIEASAREVHGPYKHSKAKPEAILATLQTIQVRFDVDVVFAGSRGNAALAVVNILEGIYASPS